MIIKEEQKVVDYFGMELTIPNYSRAIGTDKNGEVWAFSTNPHIDVERWVPQFGSSVFLCTADMDGMDWKDTLMEV